MGLATAETFTVDHMKKTGAMDKSLVRRDNSAPPGLEKE